MKDLVKISYTLPEDRVLDLMQLLIEMKQGMDEEGIESRIEVAKNTTMPVVRTGVAPRRPSTPRRRAEDQQDIANATEDTVFIPQVAAPAPTGGVRRRSRRTGGRVMYRVINPSIKVGQIPDSVRMVLLHKGPMSAQKLEEATGLGKKSIESSVWLLRDKGSVESVELQEGRPITQKKFSQAQIKAGRPLVAE